jgi:site-specific DNA-methyltransferase (adenine-specific)
LVQSDFLCGIIELRMNTGNHTDAFALDFKSAKLGSGVIVLADCLEWLSRVPANSIHAVVTDPPYGVKEYELDQLEKRANGNGGIWRIPPSFDGHVRAPLPRFTALNRNEREQLSRFFFDWAEAVSRALCPGGHVFIACNAFLSQLVFSSLLRGGDRPKNAEEEFPDVSSLPRGCYEPWGLLRKPLPDGMKVSDCLRNYGTGGLRRTPEKLPFSDVIISERTPRREKEIANHPSLKPQSFLRQIVHAALPLGEGIIVDPFMGSGSTVAAAEALGLTCIGVERNPTYFALAKQAIPRLARLSVESDQPCLVYS